MKTSTKNDFSQTQVCESLSTLWRKLSLKEAEELYAMMSMLTAGAVKQTLKRYIGTCKGNK